MVCWPPECSFFRLAFDRAGVLWGVENGADNLDDPDHGGDIHNDNPGEELNQFDRPGRHYGYPYCWSEYHLPGGDGAGAVWVPRQRFARPYTFQETVRSLRHTR